MRIAHPLILGAGPAGCSAAIALRQSNADALLLDRDAEVGDPLCGGFLSWRTVQQLERLGIDVARLGAHRVTRLRLFDNGDGAELALPQAAWGLSRHALDTAMRAEAVRLGAAFAVATVRGIEGRTVTCEDRAFQAESLFVASGKHDLRGLPSRRAAGDSALGLRLRLPASPVRQRLLADAIELHLFPGGYAGVVLQEHGSLNVCLALRKSALAEAGRSPQALFAWLADRSPALAERLGDDWRGARVDTIGAVPYGFIARTTAPGRYLLGDQAAVIPSLAGEGISIALASGTMAAQAWLQGQSAEAYQRTFAARARPPVRLAGLAWRAAETRLGARAGIALARVAPSLIAMIADRARIRAPASLAPA